MAETTEAVVENAEAPKMTDITMNHFYDKLSKRVSGYNAKLLIRTACVNSGLVDGSDPLNEDEVKQICLELIKKGGPSFQVGKEVYGQIH